MSATYRATLREQFTALWIPGTSDDLGGSQRMNLPLLDELWGNGTSDNQVDRFWCDVDRTIASNTNDDLDLRSLAAGPNGQTITFAEIRAILLYWEAANTTTATLQPGAANGWTALGASFLATIKADTWFRLISGKNGNYATGAADKVLRIANSTGATATYSIAILGTSA